MVTHADGSLHDLGGEWRSITLFGAVSAALGEQVTPQTPLETLVEYADKHDIGVDPAWGPGKLVEELFERLVVPSLVEPTFVRDYPEETSPLTRAHREIPGLTEKWDLYIDGVELATAYSELVDPVVQRERLVAQAALAAKGDPAADGTHRPGHQGDHSVPTGSSTIDRERGSLFVALRFGYGR